MTEALPKPSLQDGPLLSDIHPVTPVSGRTGTMNDYDLAQSFERRLVASVVGMSESFIQRALGERTRTVTLERVLFLLELDAFSETFVPRSKVPAYLSNLAIAETVPLSLRERHSLLHGSARDLIPKLPANSINCVVTSPPYWGTRVYEAAFEVEWADGDVCSLGHEQTPEGYIRHVVETLHLLKSALEESASLWLNLRDTFNTRAPIRRSASETLRAMSGTESQRWSDFDIRRHSAGHSFLKDGEQCMIPGRIAERASRVGYWLKSSIVWKKTTSMPEPIRSRPSRATEIILQLSLRRNPFFDKTPYNVLPASLGGRDQRHESERLSDVWCLPPSAGLEGHGAQFALALPARCISLTSRKEDLVLDPFVGAGTTTLAAARLGRRSIGFDVAEVYLTAARRALARLQGAPEMMLPDVAGGVVEPIP